MDLSEDTTWTGRRSLSILPYYLARDSTDFAMDSPAEWIIFIVFFLYLYWVAPALLVLNWLLTRHLRTRLSLPTTVATNALVSLLLLGPISSRGGEFVLMGENYYPWYLGGAHLTLDNVSWVGLLMACAVSLATTVTTFPGNKHPAGHRAR